MFTFRHLLAATVGLATLAAVSSAQATSYAYGNINFTNLSISGLGATGVTVDSANVTTRDSSGYPGAAPMSNSAGPTDPNNPLSAGSDVAQATSGPGPFPGENTYTQALLNSFGTRGDAQLVGNLITGVGTGANDVAEGRLATAGSASSTAGTTTGFNVVISTSTTQTFTLAFNASDSVIASTTAPGEIASASVSASFTVSGGTGFTTQVYSPDALNTSTTSTGGRGDTNISNASSPYSFSVTLAPGTYQFSLLSGAQEQVTAPAASPVPEPASMALLSVGLAAVGVVRRRRA